MRRAILLVALVLLAASCNRDRESQRARAVIGRALPGALAYPGSSIVTFSAGEDAGRIELSSPAAPQDVAVWYRKTLPLNGWDVQSDAVDRNGVVTIYAEKGKQPLWITLRPNTGGPGSTYTMIGAIVAGDSIKTK